MSEASNVQVPLGESHCSICGKPWSECTKTIEQHEPHRPLYQTIVVDPPWHYGRTIIVTGNAPGRTSTKVESGVRYLTMSVDEIAALPIYDLAAENAHLYLWTTNQHLEFAWEIVREWEFKPKNLLTWCKSPKGLIGFGAFSQASEFCLFATRGRSLTRERCPRTWFEWPRTRLHSQKPEAFYDLVETISPGPYLELFARRQRLGWDTWGNEALNHVEVVA